MKAPYPVPAETARLQGEAADPDNSAWVSANAGSGKTHVLSQRVIRLLLNGTDPSKILCLTYTRAAAANMANRIFGTLSGWTSLSDEELANRIAGLDGRRSDARRLGRARRLFAEALETPGGLKIQTIHAFCEAVLHQFPLEANIAAHFEMLDPRMEEALFDEARREMISGVMAADSPGLAQAFATVLDIGGEFGLDTLLSEIVRKRDGLRSFITKAGLDQSFESLLAEFGFDEADTAGSVASQVWPLPGFSPAYLATLDLVSHQVGAGRTIDHLVAPGSLAFGEPDSMVRLGLLRAAFLKASGDPYSLTWLFPKNLVNQIPDLPDRYAAAARAIIEASDRLTRFRMLEGTRAALTIADWLISRYERLKSGRGFLDFNDLITRTVSLLARPDAGPWVQYKLDKGIDHILLDEAQDTSPDQWALVRRLAEEFFSGLGARDDVRRTVFAVGDEKQSIYSFQGAAPESFDENRQLFSAKVRDAGARFAAVNLTWSFRSTDDVLSAVDRVFAREDMRRGVTHDPLIEHKAIRAGAPGYVEVWPSLGAEAVQEPDDWTIPVDHAKAPAVRLAENIATTIKGWLTSGEVLDGQGRKVMAGDIMVLVRKRDNFMHALSRSLKNRGIPVAGADRLILPAHIAVKDLAALGKYLLQPHDDLSLAAVLKSPIFALTEEQLFVLSWNRPKSQSLGEALSRQAASDLLLSDIVTTLGAWASEAAFKPVFEFYAGVLAGTPGRDGVRRRMIARLGPEAGEILDEFLSFCLAEERVGLPGLEAFLATLETAGPEIKREMDQARDEVRIMTVHAAKGLEAPVVFLADGGSAPFSEQHLPRLIPFDSRSGLGRGYLWRASAEMANTVSRTVAQQLRAAAEDEYRRLLYVGMTRAEDRLIVCGFHGKLARNPMTWHAVVEAALQGSPQSAEIPNQFTGDTVLRYRLVPAAGLDVSEPVAETAQLRQELPPRLLQPLPADEDLPRPLSPSGASALIDEIAEPLPSSRSPVLEGGDEPGPAVRRGLAIHKLLQVLPDLEPDQRPAATKRYLQRIATDWSDAECENIQRSLFAILDRPDFAALFAPGSRAEVGVMGELEVRGKKRSISGKIDRLAVTADEVLILDYKTNRPAPSSLKGVSPAHVAQLALYRALLKPLYPRHAIRAALLFTAGPGLIALSEKVMDDALARLTQA